MPSEKDLQVAQLFGAWERMIECIYTFFRTSLRPDFLCSLNQKFKTALREFDTLFDKSIVPIIDELRRRNPNIENGIGDPKDVELYNETEVLWDEHPRVRWPNYEKVHWPDLPLTIEDLEDLKK